MDKLLSKQIFLYSLDTDSFLSSEEIRLNEKCWKAKNHKKKFKSLIDMSSRYIKLLNKLIYYEKASKLDTKQFNETFESANKIYSSLFMVNELKKSLNVINEINKELSKLNEHDKLKLEIKDKSISKKMSKLTKEKSNVDKILTQRELLNELIKFNKKLNIYQLDKKSRLYRRFLYTTKTINRYKKLLDKAAKRILDSGEIRTIRNSAFKPENKISQFESYLTRTLGIEENELTTDIIVIRAFRYIIFESLIKNGFKDSTGNLYEYYASSAGQIKKKKSIYIRSDVWEKHQGTLMCGLTEKRINENGRISLNKFNAYKCLANTSSIEFENFDINRCIVVPDYESIVYDTVDYIDKDFNITRKKMKIKLNHTDGCGLILPDNEWMPELKGKSIQYRGVHFKGMLIPFDFVKFIKKYCKDGKCIVKDVYNQEHDIIQEKISVIFTASQFKLWQHYKSWDEYKKYFKDYNCKAAICGIEEDYFPDKETSYQALQTMALLTKKQLTDLASNTVSIINNLGRDKELMFEILGVTKENTNKDYLQQAIEIYPLLINDSYTHQQIKEKKESMLCGAKGGRLLLEGSKRTYFCPDLFRFAEWLFLGIENPKGLIPKGMVSCALYSENERLNINRSPHLYIEHLTKRNLINEQTKEWFITNNIYMSTHSLDSLVCMYDYDGDQGTVNNHPTYVQASYDHLKRAYGKKIVPLYYHLGIAKKEEINKENMYNALIDSYDKDIGEISNTISKILNENHNNPDLSTVAKLCYYNNAIIDFPKTRWLPELPTYLEDKIKEYKRKKLPAFFEYVKNKEKKYLSRKNESVVNMLDDIIVTKNIFFKDVESFDYKKLMKNPRRKIDQSVIDLYKKLNEKMYAELKRKLKLHDDTSIAEIKKKKVMNQIYHEMRQEFHELNPNVDYVVDVLIRYLYQGEEEVSKKTLWGIYGKRIVQNLKRNILKVIVCKDCGKDVENPSQRQIRCEECQIIHKRKLDAENKRRKRKIMSV